MKDGILILNKNKDMTSRDVVNLVCKKLGTKRVGHTGTLDPIATGVLVVAVNDGCKIIELLTSNEKEYIAEVQVGIETDTLDVTGTVLKEEKDFSLEEDKVANALNHFKGTYMQTVPKYSAVKIDGKRLYDYAREGLEVELPKREVEIKDISLLELKDSSFTFRVSVSKGTYIRSLIRDIGEYLNIPMTMKNLIRTKQGIFKIEDAISLDDIEMSKMISIKNALSNYPQLIVDKETEFKIINGCRINKKISGITVILNEEQELLALYEPISHTDIMKPFKVFKGVSNEKN